MWNKLLNNRQPLSLKWKWGILLFISLILISTVSLLIFHDRAVNTHMEYIKVNSQKTFDTTVNYLESIDQPLRKSFFQTESTEDSEMSEGQGLEFLLFLENEDVVYRFFNENQQLIYETQHVDLPPIEYSPTIQTTSVNGQEAFVGNSKIISPSNGELTGSVQYIILPSYYESVLDEMQNSLYYTAVIIVILALILAIFIITRQLRPLTYLVNSLDLVEAESLSQLRVRKPQSADEWSDLSDHINRLLDKIDTYVKSQKQFVEDVSHELRTPVAIVEGHLKMLNRWGKEDPEILEESISASLQEIVRMKGLVQEMLDLMRADHVDVDYKDEITEVYSTIRQVFNNFVILHPDFQFYLDIDKDPDELYIRMFRNHFEQVFIILLDNAVKYSTDRQEIHLAVSASVTNVQIAVQDFGEGMTDEDKERVFGRFYRVDKARSRDKGGNGLGLSIAQQLVKSYRGEIWVESVIRQGSIFYVTFPTLSDTRQIYKSKQIAKHKTIK